MCQHLARSVGQSLPSRPSVKVWQDAQPLPIPYNNMTECRLPFLQSQPSKASHWLQHLACPSTLQAWSGMARLLTHDDCMAVSHPRPSAGVVVKWRPLQVPEAALGRALRQVRRRVLADKYYLTAGGRKLADGGLQGSKRAAREKPSKVCIC